VQGKGGGEGQRWEVETHTHTHTHTHTLSALLPRLLTDLSFLQFPLESSVAWVSLFLQVPGQGSQGCSQSTQPKSSLHTHTTPWTRFGWHGGEYQPRAGS
jgi:hypothetical protein